MHSWWSTLFVPEDEEERLWAALDRDVERIGLPVHVLLTVHWHERSVATVLDRYKATLWQPQEKGELPTGVRELRWCAARIGSRPFFHPSSPSARSLRGDLLIGTEGGVQLPVRWFPARSVSGPSES